METPIYNIQGKQTGAVTLPERLFNAPWNPALIHQVVTSMQDNARSPVAHTKFRGDVRGGGKKPWRQKGTGRARHGSIRSPIWRGGGVTHGPRNEKKYARAIPRNMRGRALAVALSQKARDARVLLVDSFPFASPKTAEAKRALLALSHVSGFESMAGKRKNAALVALSSRNEAVEKSFRNLGNVHCTETRNLNAMNVLRYAYLVIENPAASFSALTRTPRKRNS